jgi:hypothetical protein
MEKWVKHFLERVQRLDSSSLDTNPTFFMCYLKKEFTLKSYIQALFCCKMQILILLIDMSFCGFSEILHTKQVSHLTAYKALLVLKNADRQLYNKLKVLFLKDGNRMFLYLQLSCLF